MKQLLIRADDLGYSYAVDLGIARSVDEGLVCSVGLMPNMPEAEHGWSLVADADIAVGQHTNVCLGKPCADPALIPSLLDENGEFHSSRTFREHFKRGEELIDFDEACIEIRAQHDRFVEIVGREPDYFEAHAVMSKTSIERSRRWHRSWALRSKRRASTPRPWCIAETPICAW